MLPNLNPAHGTQWTSISFYFPPRFTRRTISIYDGRPNPHGTRAYLRCYVRMSDASIARIMRYVNRARFTPLAHVVASDSGWTLYTPRNLGKE